MPSSPETLPSDKPVCPVAQEEVTAPSMQEHPEASPEYPGTVVPAEPDSVEATMPPKELVGNDETQADESSRTFGKIVELLPRLTKDQLRELSEIITARWT